MNPLLFYFTILFLCVFNAFARPNFILILTDDQDITLGGLKPMKNVLELIGKQGVTFNNAFTTSPICCPSRASLLTGLYQHNHNVVNNTIEGNCCSKDWQTNFEEKTFGAYLKEVGYKTFYSGKYLNQYGHSDAGGVNHVPQGWDTWIGLVGNSVYYNFTLSANGKAEYIELEYLTSVIQQRALKFLSEISSSPFLMVIAPPAPHAPFTPEPKYNGSFSGEKIPREPHFNYAKNDDKHWFVRMKPSPLSDKIVQDIDEKFSKRWESLLSVDDLVAEVISKLEDIKQLDNTYIFYTSDNGFHLGQFSMPWDKRQMYDFDIRIPLLLRGPGIEKNSNETKPTLLIDIAPTILNLAGINGIETDGKSFHTIANNKKNYSKYDDDIRSFLIEYKGEKSKHFNKECPNLDLGVSNCLREIDCKCQDAANNTYSCIRNFGTQSDTIYCQFSDDEKFEEAYDLLKDPYQLKNCVANITQIEKYKFKQALQYLKSCKFSNCHNTIYYLDNPLAEVMP